MPWIGSEMPVGRAMPAGGTMHHNRTLLVSAPAVQVHWTGSLAGRRLFRAGSGFVHLRLVPAAGWAWLSIVCGRPS